jgi:hypothetical protein
VAEAHIDREAEARAAIARSHEVLAGAAEARQAIRDTATYLRNQPRWRTLVRTPWFTILLAVRRAR